MHVGVDEKPAVEHQGAPSPVFALSGLALSGLTLSGLTLPGFTLWCAGASETREDPPQLVEVNAGRFDRRSMGRIEPSVDEPDECLGGQLQVRHLAVRRVAV